MKECAGGADGRQGICRRVRIQRSRAGLASALSGKRNAGPPLDDRLGVALWMRISRVLKACPRGRMDSSSSSRRRVFGWQIPMRLGASHFGRYGPGGMASGRSSLGGGVGRGAAGGVRGIPGSQFRVWCAYDCEEVEGSAAIFRYDCITKTLRRDAAAHLRTSGWILRTSRKYRVVKNFLVYR